MARMSVTKNIFSFTLLLGLHAGLVASNCCTTKVNNKLEMETQTVEIDENPPNHPFLQISVLKKLREVAIENPSENVL